MMTYSHIETKGINSVDFRSSHHMISSKQSDVSKAVIQRNNTNIQAIEPVQ